MHNPQFYVAVLNRYRIIQDPSVYKEKRINIYEFEFYTEDYPGGTCTDGVFRPALKGGFCLFKPGQRQKLIPPYHCYVMNIVTEDPALQKQLNTMPAFSMLWNMNEVIHLLQLMLPLKEQDTLENQLQLHSYAARILKLLIENNRMSERTNLNIFRHQEVLLAADQYIREHLSEELSLAQLARQSNLDPTYFHKLFTAAFGTTPAKQVLSYRIAAVKAGLLNESVSRRTLAMQCGFSSSAYMSTKFRQVTGMTPSQYQKITLKNE